MQKLLIAESSEAFSAALVSLLSDTFEIKCCTTGLAALHLLEEYRPEALIIDLSLPYMDGLHILQQTTHKPRKILVLTTLSTEYVLQMVKNAGADFAVILPCTAPCVASHIRRLMYMENVPGIIDPQKLTQSHLIRLGLPTHRSGFFQLCVGIPLFAQNERQLMKKELYPVIANLCGNDNSAQVEHTIREVIKEAWSNRDPDVWEIYFPGRKKPPSNKAFISALAQYIYRTNPDRIW